MDKDPAFFEKWVAAYEAHCTHGRRSMLRSLDLHEHPSVEELRARCPRLRSALAKAVIYHCDPMMQYRQHHEASAKLKARDKAIAQSLKRAQSVARAEGLIDAQIDAQRAAGVPHAANGAQVLCLLRGSLLRRHAEEVLRTFRGLISVPNPDHDGHAQCKHMFSSIGE
eukprot:2895500-Alexandrium_andersonii.AAC.1